MEQIVIIIEIYNDPWQKSANLWQKNEIMRQNKCQQLIRGKKDNQSTFDVIFIKIETFLTTFLKISCFSLEN